MKIIFAKPIAIFIIALCALVTQAKVAPETLEKLVKDSDLVIVGEILSVDYIKGVYFAKVKVKQTLKGNSTAIIYYSTERRWACDISGAFKGESGLFFFEKYEIKPSIFRVVEETNLLKETIARFTNNSELFRLSFDGRGRMPLLKNDKKQLNIDQDVILPKGFTSEISEIIQYTNKVLSNS